MGSASSLIALERPVRLRQRRGLCCPERRKIESYSGGQPVEVGVVVIIE